MFHIFHTFHIFYTYVFVSCRTHVVSPVSCTMTLVSCTSSLVSRTSSPVHVLPEIGIPRLKTDSEVAVTALSEGFSPLAVLTLRLESLPYQRADTRLSRFPVFCLTPLLVPVGGSVFLCSLRPSVGLSIDVEGVRVCDVGVRHLHSCHRRYGFHRVHRFFGFHLFCRLFRFHILYRFHIFCRLFRFHMCCWFYYHESVNVNPLVPGRVFRRVDQQAEGSKVSRTGFEIEGFGLPSSD